MKIWEAQLEQAPVIEEMAKQIWPIAYQAIISQEQIDYMLKKMYSVEAIEQDMRQGITYFLAEKEGRMVGYAAVGRKSQEDIKLHKLYRLQEEGLWGIGTALLEKSVEQALEWGGTYLILNVNKKNPAKNFYLKNQFTVRQELVLDIGGGFVMDDFIMERKL